MTALLASSLLFASACFNAFIVVIISYLEDYRGFPWIMIYILSEWISIPLIVIFSLIYMWYYFRRYQRQISLSTSSTRLNFIEYYYYLIFPPRTESFKTSWIILDLRAFASSTSYIFCMIAMMYVDSGDFILIQTVILTVGNIIVGRILFNEDLNTIIIVSLITCIVGVTCVCQPSYIFDSIASNNNINLAPVDTIGFIFAFISGLLRVFTAAVCKYSKTSVNMPWMTLFIVSNVIGFFLSTGIFVVIVMFMKFIIGTSDSDIWYNFDYSGKSETAYDDTMYGLLIFGVGGFTFISAITGTLGWRIGDVGRLGMVVNADIPVSYIAQMALLGEELNVLTYTGICLVFASIIAIFYSQWKRDSNNYNNEDLEQGYEPIQDDIDIDGAYDQQGMGSDIYNYNDYNSHHDNAFYDLEFILNERQLIINNSEEIKGDV